MHRTTYLNLPHALALLGWVAASAAAVVAGDSRSRAEIPDYTRDIRPILSARCYPCHGPDESSRKAKLRLDLREEAIRDRDGTRALAPGHPENSELYRRITAEDPDDVMPPAKEGHRLSESEVAQVRHWIADGAPYAEHWAWNAPVRPDLPPVRRDAWVRTPLDRFILGRLEREGLRPSPPADRPTLIRRLSLDLTGLPPAPEEVRRFVSDRHPDAYENLVERLLASPAYGERWARMWLDLARFADSAGYGSDPLRPNLWPWRDWVIEAFNQNMPFDQFTIEQIAGDLLPDSSENQRIATAFHRNTMTNTEGGTDDEEFRVAAVKDRANTTAQVWMGLTLGCAQCHSHKFDPISHEEYYRFFAFFNQTEDNDQPDERPTLPLPTADQRTRMDQIRARIAELEETGRQTTPALEVDLADWIAAQQRGVLWQPLRLRSWHATGGSQLESLEDGSILARGGDGDAETFVLEMVRDGGRSTALRLKALPHPSLPEEGPGRGVDGGFVLTELEAVLRQTSATIPKLRFIRVELPGPTRVLSLAEVQVFSSGTNIAARGIASQSSTAEDGVAARAIDGRVEGGWEAGSTTQTRSQDAPWWELDLRAEVPVEEIVIWNRTDRGLGTRLSEFKVLALSDDRKTAWEQTVGRAPNPVTFLRLPPEKSLKLRNAAADAEHKDFPVARAIDGNSDSKNGWSPDGEPGKAHAASFEIEGDLSHEPDSTWIITLTQKRGTNQTLGRFRLSATDQALPVRELPHAIAETLAREPGQRTAEERDQLMNHFRPLAPSLAAVRAELERQRRELDRIKPVALPVLRELATDKSRATRILNKGNFLDPGADVEPGVPAAFHRLPPDAATNRLALARWLVDRSNPLTARVMVNRLWAQVFGAGLVETEEDFGTQGTLPSHPELLDWLAVEFMERGWDVKGMLGILVNSAAYRQVSDASPRLLELDPRNRLVARAPRPRLEAEMIRDQALALSGLLSRKIGGPSVFPPQPDGLWRAAFNGERTWATSAGEDRYRRALYVFLRRTVPYPSLATFDAPSRETCTVRRLPTNTPLQAYVTLNDPVYVECAQALARRILRESGPGVTDCIRYGLELCLARPPGKEQVRILEELFAAELEHYRAKPTEAEKLAIDPLGPLWPGFSPAEAAAWTSVANVLLNLDAVLTRS